MTKILLCGSLFKEVFLSFLEDMYIATTLCLMQRETTNYTVVIAPTYAYCYKGVLV